ncbi:MAG TPA: alpha/beta hydrolase [Candidatus Binataceae bacterium]|nr:alpha/beta hydrolase [Candidatus Binataceae bacterium]
MLTDQERQFLESLAKAPMPTDLMELRSLIETMIPMMNSDPPQIGALHENVELRPGLRADVAVPKGGGPFPVVVYLHGGGWVAGSPRTHRKLGMQFAEAGFLTINVDYRLAPEHPFPAGLDDCIFATKWSAENAKRWNGDGERLAVGGDSAGGNLTAATVTSLAAENHPGAKPRAALLIYGVYDFPATLARERNADAFVGMAKAYAGSGYPDILKDQRISPLSAVKAGALPPSFVICGAADTLVPESHAIAEALKRADIRHELHIVEDMPHGFLQMSNLRACGESQRKMFDFLRRTL